MTHQRFDGLEGQRRRWAREAEEAAAAAQRNSALQALTQTRFKPGEVVLLEGQRRVRITEVLPTGYISVPSKYSILGHWMEPVVCDQPLYRYKPENDPNGATGQTTEDRLSPLPTAAPQPC